jgi:hypothetical protein
LITAGYLRVVSFRSDSDCAPEPGETVIDMSRENRVLGNAHHMKRRNDRSERDRVIAANESDLEDDFIVRGPKYQAILALARRAAAGEQMCGCCWCAPLPCHVDGIARRVNAMASAIRQGQCPDDAWRTVSKPRP